MDDESELLFFDTFSHDSCEELNLDLVQFPVPVYICEIRVIPLGARVQADFPGGYRLGATNPSTFKLEFFVNDLARRNICTFHSLGCLQYKQNIEIQMPVINKVPTDGLVLRGLYSAVTLAVYGIFAKTTAKERASPPPPPPPPSGIHTQDHRTDSSEWDRHSRPGDIATDVIHPHAQVIAETSRFTKVPTIIHPSTEGHVQYSTDMPQPVYSEPMSANVYPECIQTSGPSVPPPAPYSQYDTRYSKTWQPPPDKQHYQTQGKSYDSQVYRPPDSYSASQPSHAMWEPKDCHPPEIPTIHSRSKDRRDKPWDRDLLGYKDVMSHDRDYKHKERDPRPWDRSDSEKYRIKEGLGRDRDKDRERGRDKSRNYESYSDRGSRSSVKRPVTPPTPPSHSRLPQTPPEIDKVIGGPRTPKEEEPHEMFDESGDIRSSHPSEYYNLPTPERRTVGDPMYNLSEGEIQEGDNTEDDDGYEEIVSEEEIMSDGEDRILDMVDVDFELGDETWNYMSSFSPYHCELTQCQHLTNPTLFDFEIQSSKCNKIENADDSKKNKILELVEMFHDKEHTEKWVEALESLGAADITDLLTLDHKPLYEELIDTLISWVIEGLDFERALQQPQTAFKVRHIKAGIRLAGHLFQTHVKIIEKLLVLEVPRLLFELFDQPYMVLPVKLLILRVIDCVSYTEKGMNFLITKSVEFRAPKDFDVSDKKVSISSTKTCYQKLLDILLTKQLTRCIVSISALLEKIHLYETLQELHTAAENLVKNLQLPEVKTCVDDVGHSMEVDPSGHLDLVENNPDATVVEENLHLVITCLNDIAISYRSAWRKLAHPKRLLPAQNLLEFPKSPFDPYPGLLRMFKDNYLLESLVSLLSLPVLHPAILTAIRELMMELLRTQSGMLFLLYSSDTTNAIQKLLLQNIDEARDEITDENMAANLGMHLVYKLQTLLFIDGLLVHHFKATPKKELDDPDAVSALHHMYTMIFSPIGRLAVVEVLAMDKNLSALLPFVTMSGDEESILLQSKSVCAGYAMELLSLVLHNSENICMIESFSEALLTLSQQESTPKLQDLSHWVTPACKIQNYDHEDIPYLTGILKSHLEDASSLPAELITAVRILKHICLPPDNVTDELKYTYAIIQLYSNDGMSCFLTILKNVCDTFLKPLHQSVSLAGHQGILLVALLKPIVSMTKHILEYLILCRDTKFQDLGAVPVLLNVFTLITMIPTSSFSYHLTSTVQNEIVKTLLTYTQPTLAPEETEESLSKSLWTQMLQEVLKFVQLSPKTFASGLTVLSELLPLPLPLQAREPLETSEVNSIINHRKLWSAHLHSLSSSLHGIIISLAGTSCHPLQQLLRRVCIQLSDLALPTALVTVRAVADCLLDAFEIEPKEVESSRPSGKACSMALSRILNLLAYLVTHSSFKIPFMHILKASSKVDEKYVDVFVHMLDLMNFSSESSSHLQAQECIVSIVQSLCDPDIGLITVGSNTTVNEVLACCLPFKDQMIEICSALVQHIANSSYHYASILPALRSLVMLSEHDYGFYHIKLALEQYPMSLRSLFSRLVSSFSKENTEYFSTLSTTLEFLRLMVNGYEEGAQTGRSMLVAPSELAAWLSTTLPEQKSEDNELKEEQKKKEEDLRKMQFPHLVQLEKLLMECEEDGIDGLLDMLSSLINTLSDGHVKEEKVEGGKSDASEPVFVAAESLLSQFISRTVFLVGDVEEERLTSSYWLSFPVADDIDQEQEQVVVDLISLSEKCISGDFDLKSALDSVCTSADTTELKKDKCMSTYNGKRKHSMMNPGSGEVNTKKCFIAPMRGRGFARVTSHSTRANDLFRSRPPNTSRPPSMHVDDFVALESHHTGSSNQPQQKRQDGARGRGRGFDRGQSFLSVRGGGSGRFFSPPGPYGGRRDTTTRTDVCSSRGTTTRISNTAWGSRTSSSLAKSPTGAGIRTTFSSSRPTVFDRGNYTTAFGSSGDQRLTSQRNRDGYTDLPLQSGSVAVSRFARGTPVQGHWQETRNKAHTQRFLTGRGNARRDLNGRHPRSFTR